MKILALEHEKPGVASSEFAPYLEAEARAVWQLQANGAIREICFRDNRSEAVIVLEAENAVEAKVLLAGLPLVKHGLIDFELIGLRPYPGFARLFRA